MKKIIPTIPALLLLVVSAAAGEGYRIGTAEGASDSLRPGSRRSLPPTILAAPESTSVARPVPLSPCYPPSSPP